MKYETKRKARMILISTTLILLLITFGFLIGWLGNQIYQKKMLNDKDKYDYIKELQKINQSSMPNNLSFHLCSSECVYDIILNDENKFDDSFIINNKLNNSNCIRCNKYLESR